MRAQSRLTILSTLAVQGVLKDLQKGHGPLSGADVAYAPTAVLLERIESGVRGDLGLLTADAVNHLISRGVMATGSRVDLAVSSIGVAVRAGEARPDISSVALLKQALRDAKSIVYSRAGASGIYFADLLQRLDLADEVNAKATIIPGGLTAELVARGEAGLAIQQISELMSVPGVHVVGPLPDAIQKLTTFSAGIFVECQSVLAAGRLLDLISSSNAAPLYTNNGLTPLPPCLHSRR